MANAGTSADAVGATVDTGPLWMRGRRLDVAPLDSPVATEVCVVGLGAAGLAAIRRLHRRGIDVVGLDAGGIGGGASGRNGGFLLAGTALFYHQAVRSYGRDRAAAIYRLTLDELHRLAVEMPDVVRRTGSLRIAVNTAEMEDCRRHRRALERDGFRVVPHDGPAGTGLLLPDDAAFDPAARCHRWARRLLDAGVRLHTSTTVTAVGRRQVRTRSGYVVACERVIVTVDGGLETVLPQLRARVRTARAQMLATGPLDPLASAERPVYRRYGYEYYQQLPNGRLVLGGFRDRGGAAEWTLEESPSPKVQALLDGFLRRDLGVQAPVTDRWAGRIAFTEDRLPVVEEVDDGIVACGAYSGTGNLLGPIAARAAVDLACDEDEELARLLGSGALPP